MLLLAFFLILSTTYFVLSLLKINGFIRLILAGYLLMNAFIILLIEFLSIFQAISLENIVVANLVVLLLLGLIMVWTKPKLFNPFNINVYRSIRQLFSGRIDLIIFTQIIILGFILFGFVNIFLWVVEFDGVVYHIPRLVYWLQHKSLLPWEESIVNPRVAYPLNAELVELWVSIFSGSDRFITLVPWAAGIISIFAIYGLATSINFSRQSSLFISLAFISIPVATWQTKLILSHDINTVVFIVISLFFLFHWKNSFRSVDLFLAGVGLGLALGTKLIAFFILPGYLLIWVVILSKLRQIDIPKNLLRIFVIFLIPVIILSAYIYIQNLYFFGNVFGSLDGYTPAIVLDLSNIEGIFSSLGCFSLNIIRNLFYLFIAGKSNLQIYIGNVASSIFSNTQIESNICVDIIPFSFVPTFLPIERGFGLLSIFFLIPGIVYWFFLSSSQKQTEQIYLFSLAISFLFVHSLVMIWSPFARRYYLIVLALLLPCCIQFYDFFSSKKFIRYFFVFVSVAGMIITHMIYDYINLRSNMVNLKFPDKYSVELKRKYLTPAVYYADRVIPESSTIGIIFDRTWGFIEFPLWGENFTRYLERGICSQPNSFRILSEELPFLFVGLECQEWLNVHVEKYSLPYELVFELGAAALYRHEEAIQTDYWNIAPNKFPEENPIILIVSNNPANFDKLEIVPVINRVVIAESGLKKLTAGVSQSFGILQLTNASYFHFQLRSEELIESTSMKVSTHPSSIEFYDPLELIVLDSDYSEVKRYVANYDDINSSFVFDIELVEGDNHLLLKTLRFNPQRLLISKIELAMP